MNETSKITKIWIALALIWTAIIFPATIASFQVLEALPRKGFPGNLYDTILGWFLQPGPGLILTGSVLGVLTLLTLVTGIASLRQHYSASSKALRRHLRAGVEDNQGLSPRGFAQQSQALISVNVPLDTIFIHLRAVPDRPVFDMPHEQQKLLELLRQRTDLDPRELEMRLQDVRRIWSAQQHDLLDAGQTRNSTIEEVLQQRTAANPVAVILGAPGSGKSTTMRWVALHMAKACLLPWYRRWLNGLLRLLSTVPHISLPPSWGYCLPEGLSPAQIPILLRIRDYAPRLSANQEYSFEQFFKDQIGNDLAERLLSEMEKGHCLLLCDGLDEVASDSLRRRVSDAIYAFITRYNMDTANGRYNRFLVTSRIVGYGGRSL
jgi:predicted NACHT family NTPase